MVSEVTNKRRKNREWTDKEFDIEIIKMMIAAGMKAPAWDHYRNRQFIVLHKREDKERAFAYAKVAAKRYVDSSYTYSPPHLTQKMYAYAMLKQYTMLVDRSYVIVLLFKCAGFHAEWVSKLNPLSAEWCVAENIMLSVINEGAGYLLCIPLNIEHDVVLIKLGVPQGWMTPCFIGVDHPKEDELVFERYDSTPDNHIHIGG